MAAPAPAPAAHAAASTSQIWAVPGQNADTETMLKEFGKAHPEVKIVARKVAFADINDEVLRAVLSGTGSDLIPVNNPNAAMFAAQNARLDLSPCLAK